jgi:creatinine amidohydrolase
MNQSVFLEDLTWIEAEKFLTPETIVLIPLGAAAKEHGPHLRLNNDLVLAQYVTQEVCKRTSVVVAPIVNYHFYPAFTEYPGSTSLRRETATNLIVDICQSLAAFGPKRFYVLNTGVSTVSALKPAVALLEENGIQLRFTDLGKVLGSIEKVVAQQTGGSHADEIETSMMLVIVPERVDMSKAALDYQPDPGPLTRNPNGPGAYSPTGIYGDATLATKEKGELVLTALVDGIVTEIEDFRSRP